MGPSIVGVADVGIAVWGMRRAYVGSMTRAKQVCDSSHYRSVTWFRAFALVQLVRAEVQDRKWVPIRIGRRAPEHGESVAFVEADRLRILFVDVDQKPRIARGRGGEQGRAEPGTTRFRVVPLSGSWIEYGRDGMIVGRPDG
jgi:hypothetical protein